jgi:hypothetical protein
MGKEKELGVAKCQVSQPGEAVSGGSYRTSEHHVPMEGVWNLEKQNRAVGNMNIFLQEIQTKSDRSPEM